VGTNRVIDLRQRSVETSTPDNRTRLRSIEGGALSLTHDYDRVGNVTRIADARVDHTQQFGDDGVDRLTAVTGFGARPSGTTRSATGPGNRRRSVTPRTRMARRPFGWIV
jgi:hypothetical protein